MPAPIDHTGVRYGKIIGLRPTGESKYEQKVWLWLCDYGEKFESVAGTFVYNKHSNGCPACAKKFREYAVSKSRTTHGMTKTKEYKSWEKIKERCFVVTSHDYPNYGAKGITMSDEWRNDFQSFIDYIGPMPRDGNKYTCDRIYNSKGYFPGNVRWATPCQQARNKGKQTNNKTGFTGVKIDEKSPDSLYAVATWYGLDGKQRTKSFSYKTYGEELAILAAVEARDQAIRILNLLGAGYSENHGK